MVIKIPLYKAKILPCGHCKKSRICKVAISPPGYLDPIAQGRTVTDHTKKSLTYVVTQLLQLFLLQALTPGLRDVQLLLYLVLQLVHLLLHGRADTKHLLLLLGPQLHTQFTAATCTRRSTS